MGSIVCSLVGFFHFYLLHSFTGAGPGGLAPHARRGVVSMVGASPTPGTMHGGDGKGGVSDVRLQGKAMGTFTRTGNEA